MCMDLSRITDIEGMNFHFVNNMYQVLDIALLDEQVKRPIKLEIKKEVN